MSTLRHLQNFWIPWISTIVLAFFSNAAAQASYKVTDLGAGGNANEACAMSVNDEGWTEIMSGNVAAGQNVDSITATLINGRALIDVDGFNLDLGSLGGPNTWMNWGEINDVGQIVGYSETAAPDPNGEDICGFGTHLTCRPFLWQSFHMSALQTLGGNNGEASAINNRGRIVGFTENGTADSTCPANATNNRIQLPVLWKNAEARPKPLPTGSDPDGFAFWINEKGEIVGDTGTCGGATIHAASWKANTLTTLQELGTGAIAFGNNNRGQIVGTVGSADNTTQYGALWQDDVLINLGTLPGDLAAIATGINDRGQVVGSTWDSHFDWSHGFIYQDGVMTDLNTLLPASSNLFVTMANKINERGQISGMAIVLSGPDAGNIHAFLATPVHESMGKSIADVVHTRPTPSLPAKVNNQLLQRIGLGQFRR